MCMHECIIIYVCIHMCVYGDACVDVCMFVCLHVCVIKHFCVNTSCCERWRSDSLYMQASSGGVTGVP